MADKQQYLTYLIQMFYQNNKNEDWLSKYDRVENISELDGSDDLLDALLYIKDNTTEKINIPIVILNNWIKENKTGSMNQFLKYDGEKYYKSFILIQLHEATRVFNKIVRAVVERNIKDIDFNLGDYDVEEEKA